MMEAAKRAGVAAPAEAVPGAVDAPWSVSALAQRLDAALRSGLPQKVRVVGEVSNFTDRTHWYFDLKDAAAVVNCVMFAAPARKAGVAFVGGRPTHGLQVVATGRIEYYAKGGRVSLLVERLEPVGEGALDAAYRKLCEELRGLGYFATERKRPLPAFPRKIGVVTSRTGAALQDVLNTVGRRCAAVGVVLADVRVQGESAAGEVAAAIAYLGAHHERLGVDAILVTRGGGSKEDLWSFNDRALADVIFGCPIPVVAAIGHETDTTIAELVADERCATPTQAAMRLTPDSADVLRQVESLSRRLAGVVGGRLARETQRLGLLCRHPVLSNPGRLVDAAGERLDALGRRLGSGAVHLLASQRHRTDRLAARLETIRPTALHARAATRVEQLRVRMHAAARAMLASINPEPWHARLGRAMAVVRSQTRTRVDHLHRQLEAVSPVRVLGRGYSITLDPQGRAVRSVLQAPAGTHVTTRLADGSLRSVVVGPDTPRPLDEVPVSSSPARKPGTSASPAPHPPPALQPQPQLQPTSQLDLFGA